MFCPNCGKPMSDQAAFCGECGAPNPNASSASQQPVQQPVQQAPRAQQPYQQPVQQAPRTQMPYQQPAQIPVQQRVQQPYPQQGAGAFYGQPAPKKKKKLKGGFIALVIILAVVIVAGVVVALNFNNIKNAFASTFSSPASYYKMVEKQEAEDFAAKVSGLYATTVTNNAFVFGGKDDLSANITLSSDMTELLQGQAGVDMSWLKGMTIGVNFTGEGSNSSGELVFKINDSEFLTGDFYLDSGANSLYARINQLSSDYFRMDADNLSGLTSRFGVGEVPALDQDQLPEKTVIKEMITRYVGILVDAIDEDAVDREDGELTEGGVTEKGSWLTVELYGDDLTDVARALLTEMKGDRDFFDILQPLMRGEGLTWDVYVSEIGALLEEMDRGEDITAGAGAEMRVFVSKSGEIHGREIRVGDSSLVYSFPRDGGNFGYRLATGSEGESQAVITGSGKENGGSLNGKFTLYEDGKATSFVKTDDFNRNKLKNGEIVGKFTITPADGASGSGMLAMLGNVTEVVDVNFKSSGGTAKISFMTGEEEQITIELTSKRASGGAVNTVSDGKEVYDYADGLDMDTVQATLKDRLQKAGVPDDLLNSIFN